MTYEQEVIAFAATRSPVLIGAGLVLAAAARRWRDDRTVAALLAAAGVLLLLGAVGGFPVVQAPFGRRGTLFVIPLWDRTFDWNTARWVEHLPLAAAAACGLGAVFLRRPPPRRAPC